MPLCRLTKDIMNNLHVISTPNGYALALDGRPIFVNGCQHLWHETLEELEVALWSNKLCIEGNFVIAMREKQANYLERCLMLS